MRGTNSEIRDVARKIVRLQAELLDKLPHDSDEIEFDVSADGKRYTIRVFWGRCVLVACNDRHKRDSSEESASATIKLPSIRDADAG